MEKIAILVKTVSYQLYEFLYNEKFQSVKKLVGSNKNAKKKKKVMQGFTQKLI